MLIKKIDPDHFLKNHTGIKIKVNFLFAHCIILYWAFTDFSWTGLIIGYISYILIGKIGGDIGLHRYFSHSSFKTSNFFKSWLIVNATLIGHGSILLWTATHRLHHAKSDSVNDPHTPTKGTLKTWFRIWDKDLTINTNQIKDIVKNKKILFLHRNYFKILYFWIILLIALSYFSIYPLLFLFAFPCAGFFHETGLVNTICHKLGYRSYKTDDQSTNNIFVNLLTVGNGMHNTHHAKPYLYTTNIHYKWYEFDLMYYFIKFIKQ